MRSTKNRSRIAKDRAIYYCMTDAAKEIMNRYLAEVSAEQEQIDRYEAARQEQIDAAEMWADRLNRAIAKVLGPAGEGRTYACGWDGRSWDGRDEGPKVVAVYADGHSERWGLDEVARAVEYFEAGGPVRISLHAHFELQDERAKSEA